MRALLVFVLALGAVSLAAFSFANAVASADTQLVTEVGPKKVVALAHRMGIASRLLPVCSITLGSQPVSPLEMTDAYATLAARGIHHPPQALLLVSFSNGHPQQPSAGAPSRALPQNDADLVTYALQRVLEYGTGTAAALSRPAAGKTGTAENFQDAWFCGYVPELAACVWVGYPKAEISLENIEGVANVFGGSLPAEIWHLFMTDAVAKLPVINFPTPDFSTNNNYPSGGSVEPSSSSPPAGTVTAPPPPASKPAATAPPASPAPSTAAQPTPPAPPTTSPPPTPPASTFGPPPVSPPPTSSPTPTTEPPPTTSTTPR